jgi:hypothetical protein
MLLPKEINNYVSLALALPPLFWAGWRFHKATLYVCAKLRAHDLE